MACAIDYTQSNGKDLKDPKSLHYLGSSNQYIKALASVGAIIEPYDARRKFPVFGFGGIPRYMNVNNV